MRYKLQRKTVNLTKQKSCVTFFLKYSMINNMLNKSKPVEGKACKQTKPLYRVSQVTQPQITFMNNRM